MTMISPARKTLDNNDLNQVMASSSFSENKGLDEVLSLAGSENLVSFILILEDFLHSIVTDYQFVSEIHNSI